MINLWELLSRTFGICHEESPAKISEGSKKGEEADSSDRRMQRGHRISTGYIPISYKSLIAFWLLGLCNNYGYVVMLSAAYNIIKAHTPESHTNTTITSTNPERHCNEMSTGAILLADIIPSLIIKIISPFFPMFINVRMSLIIGLNVLGFVLVAEATSITMAICGVVSIAFASGLGEASILSYMALFKNSNAITAWSSGTGGAGFFGALSYMLLVYLDEGSKSSSLLIFLVVPVIMGLSFWFLLGKPTISAILPEYEGHVVDVCQGTQSNEIIGETYTEQSFVSKLKDIPALFKYMVPFGLVYLFEYFINQGLHELIHFDIGWLILANQYASYQLVYQIGVFISRSGSKLIGYKNTWVPAILQAINVGIFTFAAVTGKVPSIFIIWALVLWEGLLGGYSYVTTYDKINAEVVPEKREFSMGINSFADAVGISLAGAIAIPVHNYICSLPI